MTNKAEPGKTRVFLTFDVECAEQRRGHPPLPPQDWNLRVWGQLSNQSRAWGLGMILDVLQRHNLRATFFVEALGAAHFGLPGLANVCQSVRSRGQDLQLHLHPVLERPLWLSEGATPPADDLAATDLVQQTAFLRKGLEIFEACGVPSGEVKAFRAGNYGANNDTWRAMATVGLAVSSNHNLSYLKRSCRIEGFDQTNDVFDTGCGVVEVPVTNMLEPSGQPRLLQITALSFSELCWALQECHRMGFAAVTLVSHTFEYFFVDDVQRRRGRPNHLNIRRLTQLAGYLQDHAHQFQVQTMSDVAAMGPGAGWPSGLDKETQRAPRGRRRHRYPRLLEQGIKRALRHWPLPSRFPFGL